MMPQYKLGIQNGTIIKSEQLFLEVAALEVCLKGNDGTQQGGVWHHTMKLAHTGCSYRGVKSEWGTCGDRRRPTEDIHFRTPACLSFGLA